MYNFHKMHTPISYREWTGQASPDFPESNEEIEMDITGMEAV